VRRNDDAMKNQSWYQKYFSHFILFLFSKIIE
jgi:hypothetical protein